MTYAFVLYIVGSTYNILHISVIVNTKICKDWGGEIIKTTTLTPYGKAIKKRLIDISHTQTWLIEQVAQSTGLYFDRSYLFKIQTGKLTTPKIITAINVILDLPEQAS